MRILTLVLDERHGLAWAGVVGERGEVTNEFTDVGLEQALGALGRVLDSEADAAAGAHRETERVTDGVGGRGRDVPAGPVPGVCGRLIGETRICGRGTGHHGPCTPEPDAAGRAAARYAPLRGVRRGPGSL